MLRALFHGVVIPAAIAAAIGASPITRPRRFGLTHPIINCTDANGNCVYANCTEAKKAGRCNISCGDPAYCPQQDRDGDCIACEC